jgi:hypothetical protein
MMHLMANAVLVLLAVSAYVQSYQPKHQIRLRNRGQPSVTTLPVSLDDSWEDVSRLINNAKPSIDIDIIAKQISTARWESWGSKEWLSTLSAVFQDVFELYEQAPFVTKAGVILIPILAGLFAILYSISFPKEDYRSGMEPFARGNYDPVQAKVFYARHPFLVLQRLLVILRLCNRFLLNLAFDKYILRNEEKNRPQRAKELLTLITNLGPTAIKVGQALSVRPDLINAEYASALATLQDQVPPFSGNQAKELLLSELGEAKFSHLKGIGLEASNGPIASASIGQVYKGFIDDKQVAVKVQRPNVLAEIALDLYIVREFAPLFKKITKASSDLQGLANEWGRGVCE